MKLNADRRGAALAIAGDFNALELETLIRQLAALRSNMQPPVPHNFPGAGEPSTNVLSEDDPTVTIALHRDKSFRLWIRSAGLGWCVYKVPVSTARGLHTFLAAKFAADQPGPDLFGPQIDGPTH